MARTFHCRPALRFAFWLVVLFAVMVGSLVPPDMTPETIPSVVWNVGHLPAYGLLTLATLWLVHQRPRRPDAGTCGIALAVVVFSGLLEVLQPLTGRHADPGDVAVNAVGVGLALLFWSLAAGRMGTRRGGRMPIADPERNR